MNKPLLPLWLFVGAVMFLGAFMLVTVLFSSSQGYIRGYVQGQRDYQTGHIVVELQKQPDGTVTWATTQPIEVQR